MVGRHRAKHMSHILFIFGSGWGLNPRPYIFYILFQPTELNSRGHILLMNK